MIMKSIHYQIILMQRKPPGMMAYITKFKKNAQELCKPVTVNKNLPIKASRFPKQVMLCEVSVLSCTSKIFERVYCTHLMII